MDYKEKLRLAKEALDSGSYDKETIEYIFPELKESEDEMIRKVLLGHFSRYQKEEVFLNNITMGDIVSWLEKQGNLMKALQISNAEIGELIEKNYYLKEQLEKQGEQNPDDKVEPKFHEGDWVIDKQGIVHQIANVVENVTIHTYGYDIVGGGYFNDKTEGVRLWTIQDAKDGDVLADGNLPFIFKKIDSNKYSYAYCGISVDDGFKIESDGESGEWTWTQDIKPATKEQCDTLMKAMADAGYTFDFENKELKKIEQSHVDLPNDEDYGIDGLYAAVDILQKTLGKVDGYQTDDGLLEHKCAINAVKELSKQKPAWSEEDEKMLEDIKYNFEFNKEKMSDALIVQYDRFFDKVKSLKPQPKQEWKQENTDDLTDFENAMMHIGGSFFGDNAGLDPNDTKTIKEQANLLLSLAPKQEWNEEGENNILFLTSIIEECFKDKEKITLCGDTVCANFTKEDVIDRLKSLRPQNWTKEDKERYISCLQRLSTGNPEQPETINSKWFKEHVYLQSTWKPSDEQIELLREVQQALLGKDCHNRFVNFMYELKRLREE